jgi:mRNA-degrading endonuclease HigB of HigAB toxin-antitoxin module
MFENQQIITDIKGNHFVVITYNDLDGKKKIKVEPYNPEKIDLEKDNIKEIITDIAGNQFIIVSYTDLEGNEKKEIKAYNPETLHLKNNKVVVLNR